MILADFKCNSCGHHFESFVKHTIRCSSCDSSDVTKLLSAPAQLNTNCADKPKHRSSMRFRK